MDLTLFPSFDKTTQNYNKLYDIYRRGTFLQIQCIKTLHKIFKLQKLKLEIKNYTKTIDSNKIVSLILFLLFYRLYQTMTI